jgi:hypothetical protein
VLREAVQGQLVCVRGVHAPVQIGISGSSWVLRRGCLGTHLHHEHATTSPQNTEFEKGSLLLHMHLQFGWNNETTSNYALTLRISLTSRHLEEVIEASLLDGALREASKA